MSIPEVLDLLRCPVCRSVFTQDGAGVRCARGHRFDLARQGHLNLLQGPQPRHADTPEMVAARERFLGGGHYRTVADALVDTVGHGLARLRPHPPGQLAVLEAGAGTGYYLAALLNAFPGRGIALDISSAAARRAARAHRRIGSVVADTWQPLPVVDGSMDAVTCVFAPRNPAEFARVLRPDGLLVVVSPQPDHLAELRLALDLLDVGEDKQERLAQALDEHFTALDERAVVHRLTWSRPVVADLVAMGPNAFHRTPAERDERVAQLPEPMEVTLAVAVSTWARRP